MDLKNKKTYVNCGKAEEHDCTADAWCTNYKESGHTLASKNCNKYLQEKLILQTMAEHGRIYGLCKITAFPVIKALHRLFLKTITQKKLTSPKLKFYETKAKEAQIKRGTVP